MDCVEHLDKLWVVFLILYWIIAAALKQAKRSRDAQHEQPAESAPPSGPSPEHEEARKQSPGPVATEKIDLSFLRDALQQLGLEVPAEEQRSEPASGFGTGVEPDDTEDLEDSEYVAPAAHEEVHDHSAYLRADRERYREQVWDADAEPARGWAEVAEEIVPVDDAQVIDAVILGSVLTPPRGR